MDAISTRVARAHEPGSSARAIVLSRPMRATKAALVATFSTLIALGSHVLAGGSVPGLLGILVPLWLSFLVCLPLSGRLRSLPRLAFSVVAAQLLFHWLFVLGATGPAVRLEGGTGGHAGHGAVPLSLDAGAIVPAEGHADGGMWLGHAVAAALTIAFIRRGETALLGLRRLAALLVRALVPALTVVVPALPAPARSGGNFSDSTSVARRSLAVSISRRGPPAALLLAHL